MDSYYNQYINQYRIYTAMNADKLASFRVDSDLWQQFQGHAKENNTNASALLVAYIKSVVNTGNVITLNQIVNTSSESNNPSLSIQDIDNRIDEKIKQSIQNINTLSIQNIEDLIDARIASACQLGDIRDAIAICYADMMGNFNGLVSEIESLKKLQSIPPAAAAADDQLPMTDDQLPMTDDQLPITNNELTMTSDQLPDLDRSKVENIRGYFNRKKIKVDARQIRKALSDAGWDGNNWEESRNKAIEILMTEIK